MYSYGGGESTATVNPATAAAAAAAAAANTANSAHSAASTTPPPPPFHLLPASSFLQELIDYNRKKGHNRQANPHLRTLPVPGTGGSPAVQPDQRQFNDACQLEIEKQQQIALCRQQQQQQQQQQQEMEDTRNRSLPQQNNGHPQQQQQQQQPTDGNQGLTNNADQGSNQWAFMSNGTKTWNNDKNMPLEDDFKLEYMVEYMELDEFLTENEIPLESVLQEQQHLDDEKHRRLDQPHNTPTAVPVSNSQSAQAGSKMRPPPPGQPNGHPPPPPPNTANCPPPPPAPPVHDNSVMAQIKTEGPVAPPSSVGGGSGPVSDLAGSGGGYEGGQDYVSRSVASLNPSAGVLPASLQQQSMGNSGGGVPHDKSSGAGGNVSLPPPPPPPPLPPQIDDSPGSFSMRKRKKQLVNEERKDEKYWERRRKNNMAAKRSRDARRAKETQIAIQATFLERENKSLATELSKARAENHLLRERLQKYEAI